MRAEEVFSICSPFVIRLTKAWAEDEMPNKQESTSTNAIPCIKLTLVEVSGNVLKGFKGFLSPSKSTAKYVSFLPIYDTITMKIIANTYLYNIDDAALSVPRSFNQKICCFRSYQLPHQLYVF
ncbi:hypothetical protein IFM89_022099 [Coptis chinensis]|uniref:Uncharacterized protein n=1 Tax=Coptis chinensis TaxID=261450 RepID=A0A835ICQ9_9MAGN|nr:hypothetical protein IFM89_022099 [Coptis chinensis]